MLRALLALALAAVVALPAAAQSPAAQSPAAPTPAERAQLDRVLERGRLIHAIDRAAWVVTDDFMAKAPAAVKAAARGYVVEPSAEGFAVTFYDDVSGRRSALYVGRVAGGRVVGSEVIAAARRAPLTPAQTRLVKAREAAATADYQSCTGAFNVTAIPPAFPAAPLDVYLLSAQVNDREYPAGGHFRLVLAPDGKLVSSRKFTNSCLSLSGAPDSGGPVAALMVTHLLDPLPTEIHVFTALSAGKPLYVGAGDRVWSVTGEAITLIGNIGEEMKDAPATDPR
ncbi:MAG TPA: hypothetical protein VF589_09265 [Allosphingosinicella sp.]|jgi:hypothetical protein